jgi:hypothetical protein
MWLINTHWNFLAWMWSENVCLVIDSKNFEGWMCFCLVSGPAKLSNWDRFRVMNTELSCFKNLFESNKKLLWKQKVEYNANIPLAISHYFHLMSGFCFKFCKLQVAGLSKLFVSGFVYNVLILYMFDKASHDFSWFLSLGGSELISVKFHVINYGLGGCVSEVYVYNFWNWRSTVLYVVLYFSSATEVRA